MKDELKVILIQSQIFWKNKEKNLHHYTNLISCVDNSDIILLPEMFNTAFCPDSIDLSETMTGKTVKWMQQTALKKNSAIAGSLMITENNKIYNRAIWVSKNGEIFKYDKRHLFSLVKEDQFLTAGVKRIIVDLEGWKICPLICYDLRFPVFSRNNVNYDVLIYLANWPVKRIDAWDTLLKARSIENQCYTIGVNRIGIDANKIPFNGKSKAYDAFGNKIFDAKENTDNIFELRLSSKDLKLKRRQMNFLKDQDHFILK